MELFHSILVHTLSALITVVDIALLLRAVMSWFDPDEDNRFYSFLYLITEPLIIPVRRLFERFHWMENSPLDVPFFVVVIIFWILRVLVR